MCKKTWIAGEISPKKHLVRQFLELKKILFLQAIVERTNKALDSISKRISHLKLKASLHLSWKQMKLILEQNSIEC